MGAKEQDIVAELNRSIADISEDVRSNYFSSNHVPSVLYHYTTQGGLTGILDSKVFWATHIKHLNDRKEMTYGDILVVQEVKQRLHGHKLSPLLTQAYERMIEDRTVVGAYGYNVPYIASFSNAGNLSYQWKNYADHKQGYCIGIRPYSIYGKLSGPYISSKYAKDITFVRIEYDKSKQERLYTDFLTQCEQHVTAVMTQHPGVDESLIYQSIAKAIGFELMGLSLIFKRSQYQNEKEWRVIKLDWENKHEQSQYDICYRGNQDEIPYVKLDFHSSKHHNLLPLASIHIGSNNSMTPEGLRLELKQRGYTGRSMPTIKVSKL